APRAGSRRRRRRRRVGTERVARWHRGGRPLPRRDVRGRRGHVRGDDLGVPPGFRAVRRRATRRVAARKAAGLGSRAMPHVIWDWNGTLFDDGHLVIEGLNAVLADQGLPAMDAEAYRAAYTRPVQRFYERL